MIQVFLCDTAKGTGIHIHSFVVLIFCTYISSSSISDFEFSGPAHSLSLTPGANITRGTLSLGSTLYMVATSLLPGTLEN